MHLDVVRFHTTSGTSTVPATPSDIRRAAMPSPIIPSPINPIAILLYGNISTSMAISNDEFEWQKYYESLGLLQYAAGWRLPNYIFKELMCKLINPLFNLMCGLINLLLYWTMSIRVPMWGDIWVGSLFITGKVACACSISTPASARSIGYV